MKTIVLILSIFSYQSIIAQTVTDNANNGQLKRMVFEQWDDWQPTPETGFLGIPKNLLGWTYWRIIHRAYWKGEDQRPYRATPDGPFVQNYASLTMQEMDDMKIRDSMQKVSETNIATYVSMSGGAGDVAWKMYFGKQFTRLLSEINSHLISASKKHPIVASKILSNKHYKDYLEYLEITKDKLEAIHNSLVDRGERIITYLEIQKDLQKRNNVMHKMIANYIQLTKMPTVQEIKVINKNQKIHSNDAEIVKKILANFNF